MTVRVSIFPSGADDDMILVRATYKNQVAHDAGQRDAIIHVQELFARETTLLDAYHRVVVKLESSVGESLVRNEIRSGA